MKPKRVLSSVDSNIIVTDTKIREALESVEQQLADDPRNITLLVAKEGLIKLLEKKSDSLKSQKMIAFWFGQIVRAIISGSLQGLLESYEIGKEIMELFDE